MAFNPFKNKPIVEPNIEEDSYDNELLSYGEDAPKEPVKTEVVADHIKKDIPAPKFNLPELESIQLSFILENLQATKIKDNQYQYLNNVISLKENKWYNTTAKKGQVNAISLTKHLISLKNNINEVDNQKVLFMNACTLLTNLNKKTDIKEIKPVAETDKNIETSNNNTSNQNESREDYFKKLKAQAEQANNIPLDMVMEFIGANNNEDNQAGKWKVWATGDNIGITGNTQWYSWKAQKGGKGAISLLMFHLSTTLNIDDRVEENKKYLYKEAIRQLSKEFSDDFEDISNYDFSADIQYKEPFSMPHIIDFKINQVRNYLNTKRELPLWIINKQINEGLLFAGFPSDWKEDPNLRKPEKLSDDKVWATFLSINGEAAEMRNISTADQYSKILAKGSSKELGGYLVKAEKDCSEKTVSALEASIDVMSYHAIYPGRIATSCMGVNFNLAVSAALETLDRPNWKFQFCFDNDLAGNEAASRFKDRMIEEIGIEEYKKHIQDGSIGYFDLGIRCLKESIENNKIFYLDVNNNDVGKDVVMMFQEQLFKSMPKEEVKKLISEGKIKYLNTCPSFGLIKDPKEEAKIVYNLLSSNKPYYLRINIDDNEKPEITENRIAFEEEFKKLALDNVAKFAKEGKIIFNKNAVAKDWNEYFIYCKAKPEFKQYLHEQEKHYSHYNTQDNQVKKNKP